GIRAGRGRRRRHVLPGPLAIRPHRRRRGDSPGARGQPGQGGPMTLRLVKRLVRTVFDRFLLMPIGALIALIWANTASESYFVFAHRLSFAVNEIGMAFFFALMAQEVAEAVMPGGALQTWRRWSLAIVGALGGMAGAVAVYLGLLR